MNPWDEAPEWANYRAQDLDGEWWWFENKPVINEQSGQWYDRYQGRTGSTSNTAPNWQSTLEGRPKR